MKSYDRLLKHCGSFATVAFLLLLVSHLTQKLRRSFSNQLPYLAFWLQRSSAPRNSRLRSLRLGLPQPVRAPENTTVNSEPSRVGSVRFDPLIGVMTIPSSSEWPQEKREHCWWQPDDFGHFLRTRLDIAEAYKTAAQSLGVEILDVSSVGSHAKAAHQATIEAYPSLKDESRRGLGLGRRHQRARNRDTYLAAVINEQGRQRQYGLRDTEALATVAREVSRKDTCQQKEGKQGRCVMVFREILHVTRLFQCFLLVLPVFCLEFEGKLMIEIMTNS